jgi:hypothetical protein
MTYFIEDEDVSMACMNVMGFLMSLIWLFGNSILSVAVFDPETASGAYILSTMSDIAFVVAIIVLVSFDIWWYFSRRQLNSGWL